MIVIVPNCLRDAINKKLDDWYKIIPEAEKERDAHYQICLNYFDEHGEIPEFEIRKK
jgi:hypothetical protein